MTAPGLQAERTALSWSRTALAVLANGGLLLLPSRLDDVLHPVLAVAALLLAAATALGGRSRGRALAAAPAAPDPHAARRVVGLGSAVTLLAVGVGVAVVRG